MPNTTAPVLADPIIFPGLDVGRLPGSGMIYARPDFGANSILPLVKRDTHSGGTPTQAITGDALVSTCDNTDELQVIGVDENDVKRFNASRGIYSRGSYLFPAGATGLETAGIIYHGFSTNYNSDMASQTYNFWVKITLSGGAVKVFFESDDGTTDNNDQDTGLVVYGGLGFIVETYFERPVTGYAARHAHYRVYTIDSLGVNRSATGRLSMAALPDNTLLQPVSYLKKASGTAVPTVSLYKFYATEVAPLDE